MPGMGELIVILLIVLVVFGANKLPGIGDALGRSIKNFKRASAGNDEIEVTKKKKSLSGGKAQPALAESDEDEDEDEEFEEVVVRRKVQKKAPAPTAEG
jgi:sec-independent protein translocase protein TatA